MLLSRATRALPFSLALGALSAFGFAPFALWPLTILCLAILLGLIVRAETRARAFGLGWCFALGQFVVGLNWIATAFTFQAAMPAWLGWVAVVLLSLYLAVYPALGCLAAWLLTRGRSRASFVLLSAAAWIVSEWLRATAFTGFAWNPLGVIWMAAPGVPALAPLVGTYALSGLTVLLAGFVMRLGEGAVDAESHRDLAWIAAPLLVVSGGAAIYAATRAPAGPAGVQLRVVQPNINQNEKWAEGAEYRNFARLARLTGQPGPLSRLILWPEVAVPWYLDEDETARAAIAALLGPRDLLLTGAIHFNYDREGRPITATNSLFGMDPRGRLLGRYDKSHLVPYGEYLPMRPILSRLGLSRLAPGDMDFAPGPGPRDIPLPGLGRVGGQICYEIIFSGHVVDRGARPRFLFNPSNDAWFGRWGPPQHLAQARLRAAEEGVPIVRSTPTGISAVVDADGRLIAALPWHTAGAIDAALPGVRAATPFALLGNVVAGVIAAILAVMAFATGSRRR